MNTEERKKFLIKMSAMSSLMLYELDKAEANSKESNELRELLEKHIELTYNTQIIRSTTFLQTLENKLETVVKKTIKEFNLKL